MTSDRLWVNSSKSTKPADNSISRWSVKIGLVWETLLNPVGRWYFSRHICRDSALFSTTYEKVMAITLNWDAVISDGQGSPLMLSLLRPMCNSCSCSLQKAWRAPSSSMRPSPLRCSIFGCNAHLLLGEHEWSQLWPRCFLSSPMALSLSEAPWRACIRAWPVCWLLRRSLLLKAVVLVPQWHDCYIPVSFTLVSSAHVLNRNLKTDTEVQNHPTFKSKGF